MFVTLNAIVYSSITSLNVSLVLKPILLHEFGV